MAADTRQKRMSIMNLRSRSMHGIMRPVFEADGVVNLDDKQHLLGLYSGIPFASGLNGLLVIPHHYRGGFNRMHGGFSA